MPAHLSFEEAAPSTEGSHYALALIRKAKVTSGQDALVYGATGAIGSAAVQLLKQLGAKVTAVCGPEHLELVKGLGADRVIYYTAQDFTRDTQRYDVVLDAVGKSSFLRCRRLLKPGGVYLSSEFGPLAQNLVLALITPLRGGKKVMLNLGRDDPRMASYFRRCSSPGRSGRSSTGGIGWTRSLRPTGMSRRGRRSATSWSLSSLRARKAPRRCPPPPRTVRHAPESITASLPKMPT